MVVLFLFAVPPQIKVHERDFYVLLNHTVILPCQAVGEPHPKILWKRNGQKIAFTNNSTFSGFPHLIPLHDGRLVIIHVR